MSGSAFQYVPSSLDTSKSLRVNTVANFGQFCPKNPHVLGFVIFIQYINSAEYRKVQERAVEGAYLLTV